MANNKLDVTVDVKVNGNEALAEISKLKSNISGVGSNVTGEMNKASNSVRSTGKEFTGLSGKVRAFSESFSGLNGVISGVMGTIGLNSFKSMTLDMGMAREQSKALLATVMHEGNTFAESQAKAQEFMDTIRTDINGSIVKNQMMIDSLNGIKLSTGMANEDLKSLTGVIKKVGEASLLMGDDQEHATFVMKEAFAGLNGDFQVLKEQFGITADKMKAAGWSGAADDVDGYRAALEKCLSGLGDMGQVMDTTTGKINKIQSSFNKVGLEIGQQMTPYVDMAADAFLKADADGNILAKTILYMGGAASTFASVAPTLKPMFDTLDSIKDAVDGAKDAFDKIKGASDTWNSLKDKISGAKDALVDFDLKSKVVSAASTIKSSVLSAWSTLTTNINRAKDAIMAFELRQKLATIAQKAHTIATKVWSAVTKLATIAQAALNVVLTMNPIGLLVIAIVGLIAVLGYLYYNNEQVRNAINALGSYLQSVFVPIWDALSSAVMGVVDWFTQLFNGSKSLESALGDVVNTFMQFTSIGQIINVFSTFMPAIMGFFTQLNQTIQMKILEIKLLIITQINTFINQLVMRIYSIVTGVRRVFSLVVNTIMLKLNQARAIAGMLAMMIRNMIVTRFNLIVARTRAIFGNIVNAIRQRLSSAVSAARTKAQQILQGIRDKVAQIPEAVKQEFDKIKEKIRSALDAAKNVAVSKINDLVSAVKGALGIASPGFIQRMVTWEFNSLEGIIDDSGIRATNSAAKAATSIVGTWNSNMTSLGVSMEERFDAFNPLRAITDMPHVGADLNIVGNKMNGATTTPNNNISTNNTVNNDDHTIIYQVDHMSVDLNQLPGTEKERFYNMLSELFPGGA